MFEITALNIELSKQEQQRADNDRQML